MALTSFDTLKSGIHVHEVMLLKVTYLSQNLMCIDEIEMSWAKKSCKKSNFFLQESLGWNLMGGSYNFTSVLYALKLIIKVHL